MNKLIALLFCGLIFPLAATAKYVDPDEKVIQVKRENKMNQLLKKCKKTDYSCRDLAIKKAHYEFPSVRGSKEYIKKHYSNLTKSQAKEKLRELKKIYEQVEDDDSNPDDWHGKLRPVQLDAEARYIGKKYFGAGGYGVEQIDVILKMH
ncbi:hypothetical protein HV888_004584 [Salmonella enterica]|nr:hypothetical protein [Salmonella enterica]